MLPFEAEILNYFRRLYVHEGDAVVWKPPTPDFDFYADIDTDLYSYVFDVRNYVKSDGPNYALSHLYLQGYSGFVRNPPAPTFCMFGSKECLDLFKSMMRMRSNIVAGIWRDMYETSPTGITYEKLLVLKDTNEEELREVSLSKTSRPYLTLLRVKGLGLSLEC